MQRIKPAANAAYRVLQVKRTFLFLAAWIGFNVANAEQLEIKGVRPGMDLEEVKVLYPNTICVPWSTSQSDTQCMLSGFMTYATVRGELQAFLLDGRVMVVWVTIDSKNFDDVASALREKYGKPFSSHVDKAQNLYGATFTNHTITWVAGGATLSAKKYAEKISESSITLRASASASQSKKIKDDLKEKAKDL